MTWRTRILIGCAAAVVIGAGLWLFFASTPPHPGAAAPAMQPKTAARAPLAAANGPGLADTPISFKPVCETAAGAQHSLLAPVRQLFLPQPAFAQYQTIDPVGGHGEIHLVTLGGFRYDFQAVGEFVAFSAGDLQIQVRLQPYNGSRSLSVATALAVSANGSTVAVYALDPHPVWIDHKPVALDKNALSLPQDTLVERQGNGLVVRRQGAFEIRVSYGGYLDFLATMCPPYPAQIGGLLGRGGDRVPAARDGTPLMRTDAWYDQLYHHFGNSWRVDQSESLFDYAPGESTATFTDPNFPYVGDPAAALSDAARQEADATCRKAGIADPGVLAECVLDVAATGDPAFADNDALAEAAYESTRGTEHGSGRWRCTGASGDAKATCELHDLTGALVGSMVSFTIETLQGDGAKPETLSCGPVTEAFQAPCRDALQGVGFQGARATERVELRSNEIWEQESRANCEPPKAAGERC